MPRTKFKAETIGNYRHVKVGPDRCRVIGTIRLGERGVLARVCCPQGKIREGRCTVGTQVKSVLYPKDKFTSRQAEAHARSRFKK